MRARVEEKHLVMATVGVPVLETATIKTSERVLTCWRDDSRLVRRAARRTSITCSSRAPRCLAVVSGAGAMAYPPPPDFYKLYAPRPDDPEAASRWTPPPAPPPPVKGAYTVFGASHTVRRDLRPRVRVRVRNVVSSPLTRRACPRADRDDRTPLRAEQTVPQRGRWRRCVPRPRAPDRPLVLCVIPQVNRNLVVPALTNPHSLADLRAELARLNKEVLDRFIALTEDMIETPSAYERRVEEITLLCNNVHHLLNAIRPSQARATLEHALSEQAKQKRERLEEVRAATERAERAMENVPAHLKQAVEAATAEADRDEDAMRE